jgi:hypothetical protein
MQYKIKSPWTMTQLKLISESTTTQMCSRLIELQEAAINGVSDPQIIFGTAAAMDTDLDTWRLTLEAKGRFTVLCDQEASSESFFRGKRHVYCSLSVARMWNSWRALRILVNRIILDCEITGEAYQNRRIEALSIIHNLSADICISAANHSGSPSKSCLQNETSAKIWVQAQQLSFGPFT